MSLNLVAVMGNLVRDPESRFLPNGTAVCEFSIAVNEKRGDGEKTSYIECTAFAKTAEFVSKYFTKGKPAIITGRLVQESWNDKSSGEKRSKLKVTAERVDFAGGPPPDGGLPQPRQKQQPHQAQAAEGGGWDDEPLPF